MTISQHAWNQAPAKSGLAVGASISLEDALYIMLVKSANDMAVAVAEAIGGDEKTFVAQMNLMAKQMGLTRHAFRQCQRAQEPGPDQLGARPRHARALCPARLSAIQPMFETQKVKLGTTTLETSNGMLEQFAGTTGMKTGFICQSGLNIVATVERDGRSLLAVVLGASSARERNELAAQMFLRGLSGALTPTGQTVIDVANLDGEPTDMTPLICGKKAKDYVKQREAAFPMGLKGKPSYLTDKIAGPTYVATELAKVVKDVPLPRPRPLVNPALAAR